MYLCKIIIQEIEAELSRLDNAIENCHDTDMIAVHYCRRGAVFRKVHNCNVVKKLHIHGMYNNYYKLEHFSIFIISIILYLFSVCFIQHGNLKRSLDDLNQAVSRKPTFSDSYWHRHLLFLIQGDYKRAIEDLSFLLKQNKKHVGALRSKAVLLVRKGDLSSAMYSMSQAIALHPDDPDLYFARAEIYEKVD